MPRIDEAKMAQLLSHTQSLLNHIYWVQQEFKFKPVKKHTATAINYTDINERRTDFLSELINTIVSWVYGKAQRDRIFTDIIEARENDLGNASSFLANQAFSKFRPGNPQGQFGELLLFNFIQHFFHATPLLRKQRITTSVGHERFGADAIHYKRDYDTNQFYLGESKCYKSDYQFNTAFNSSINSIVSTFNHIDDEINLYTYDDFIEPELEELAKSYKSGVLTNVHFELVCLTIYNETKKITGTNESEIKSSILSIISKRCESINEEIYTNVNGPILNRLNYIIFPVWDIASLLNNFQSTIGAMV